MNIQELHKLVGEAVVEQQNTLRFTCAPQMNAALKSCTSMIECHRFLYAVGFTLGPSASSEMFGRIQAGESFTEITNDFNLRKLL